MLEGKFTKAEISKFVLAVGRSVLSNKKGMLFYLCKDVMSPTKLVSLFVCFEPSQKVRFDFFLIFGGRAQGRNPSDCDLYPNPEADPGI